jgi:hypothetical protein
MAGCREHSSLLPESEKNIIITRRWQPMFPTAAFAQNKLCKQKK